VANSPSQIKDQGPLDLDLEKGKGNEQDNCALDAPSELIKKKDSEIRLLKREYNFLTMHKSRATQALEKEVSHLLEANKELHRMLDRYREGEYKNARSRKIEGEEGLKDELDRIATELESKDLEIEEKIGQIADLEEQLSSALQLKELLDNLQPNDTSSMTFRDEISRLEKEISSAASFLSQSFSIQASELLETGKIDPELNAIVQATLKDVIILSSTPHPALCGLLFGFVRSRIFYSNCWTALHFEGYMLRGYQQAVHNGGEFSTPH
jgi:Chromosome segregation ATPases